jgi:hypothetical protein
MLDQEFKRQRARTVRDLADKATDPIIKKRLQDLAARYEEDLRPHSRRQTCSSKAAVPGQSDKGP